jgi:hypothetical protein
LSHSACPSMFSWWLPFEVQNLKIFISPILSLLWMLLCHLKTFCTLRPWRFFSYVFFEKFCILALMFKSIVHFELIFVCGIQSVSKFIFHVDIKLCPHNFLKRPSFLQWIAFMFYQKLTDHACKSLFSDSVLFH